MPPGPCDLPGVDRICDAPGDLVGAATGSAWEALVASFSGAVGRSTELLFTFWTDLPGPDLEASGGTVEFLRSSTSWYVGALAVAAFLVAAARIALTRRGEQATLLSHAMLRLLVATFLGVPAVTALTAAGDAYSDWILDRSTDGDFGGRIFAVANVANLAGPNGVGSALVLLFSILALAGSIGQMFMMFVRAGMLPVLTGLWPLFAAVSNTESGKSMHDRALAWLVAFLLYKPAASTVYAAGFHTVSSDNGVVGTLSGLFLLLLAALTLPALLRLTVPAVAAAAGGGSGGGGVAVAGVLATGALAATGGGISRPSSPGVRAGGLDSAAGSPTGSGLAGAGRTSWSVPRPASVEQGGAGGAEPPTGQSRAGGAVQVAVQAAGAAGSGVRSATSSAAGEEESR